MFYPSPETTAIRYEVILRTDLSSDKTHDKINQDGNASHLYSYFNINQHTPPL